MKKCVSILIAVLFLTGNILVNASQEITYEYMLEYLVEHQLPEVLVKQLSYDDVVEAYNNIAIEGIQPEVFCASANIDANTSSNQVYGMIDQDDFDVSIVLLPFYTGNSLDNLLVGIAWQWENASPFSRLEDVVKVTWDPDCFSFDSDSFLKSDFRYTYSGECIEYNETTLPAETTLGALAFYSNVYSGFGADRGGVCFFDLYPSKPIYKGDAYSTSIAMTYYHDASFVPLLSGLTISCFDNFLDVSYTGNSVDTLSCSTVFMYG